jgi:hypothetical protein
VYQVRVYLKQSTARAAGRSLPLAGSHNHITKMIRCMHASLELERVHEYRATAAPVIGSRHERFKQPIGMPHTVGPVVPRAYLHVHRRVHRHVLSCVHRHEHIHVLKLVHRHVHQEIHVVAPMPLSMRASSSRQTMPLTRSKRHNYMHLARALHRELSGGR